jgi:type II restriction enzyme
MKATKDARALRRRQGRQVLHAHHRRLHRLYPGNRNVRPKIRQQLQVLRDQGYLDFIGPGRYRLRLESQAAS